MAELTITITGTVDNWTANPANPVVSSDDQLNFYNDTAGKVYVVFDDYETGGSLPCLPVGISEISAITIPDGHCFGFKIAKSCDESFLLAGGPPGTIHIGT